MNKYNKNYKSKHKSLVERLTKPRTIVGRLTEPRTIAVTITIGPRHYIGLAALALTSILGIYNTGDYLVRKYYEMKQEQRIERIIDEDKEVFEYFKEGFELTTHNITNQEGKSVRITSLIKKSMEGKEAKKYAESLVQEAYAKNKGKKFDTLESTIQLAKDVIDNARTYLQLKDRGGQSTYSRAYEYQKDFTTKELLAMEEELDKTKCAEDQEEYLKYCRMLKDTLGAIRESTQTFDEFRGPKDGKKLVGDCNDFSPALTAIYHAVKEHTEENEDKDDFYKALAEGLDYYRIYSIGIDKHMLNLSITLKDKPEFEVIEPQNKSKKHDIEFRNMECKIISDEKGNEVYRVFVRYTEDGKDVEKKVKKIFNKNFYAESKE